MSEETIRLQEHSDSAVALLPRPEVETLPVEPESYAGRERALNVVTTVGHSSLTEIPFGLDLMTAWPTVEQPNAGKTPPPVPKPRTGGKGTVQIVDRTKITDTTPTD
jgi:hypothetical protein